MARAKQKPAQQKSGKQKSGQQKSTTGGAGKAGQDKGGQDKGGANRRRFDRRDTHIVAQLTYDGVPVEGTVTNLSLEGCLFTPRIDIPVGGRVKLKLAGESKAVPATVKAVSDLGVHCLLHAGGATLGRLSAEVDDMALLMLNASRPHVIEPAAKKKPATRTAAKKKAVKKAAAPARKAAPKKAATKARPATRKTPAARKTAAPKKRR